MSSRKELARRIYAVSNVKGRFVLRSGVTSEEYFDKYLFESDPILLRQIAQEMSQLIPAKVDALAGLEMGGIPLATVLSQFTGLPALFVRKQAKEYGTCKFAEGGEISGRKLVVIEDVVTSGGQIIESSKALRILGGEIVGVLCVIDRESGGKENLSAEGLALQSVFTMTELRSAYSGTR
ncbi:MAG: orotate phosphoribosyltransferase [Deltaproteobacteria bacterium]|nr:orotate phosphoribosyltransferase [Deltaproteobacteria bacterium]